MTEEEKQELEALRQEKHLRTQTRRAEEGLAQAGVPATFAALLVGQDDTDTDQRTQQFCAAYQAALAEDVRSRLPATPPIVMPPVPQRPRRGVHRVR